MRTVPGWLDLANDPSPTPDRAVRADAGEVGMPRLRVDPYDTRPCPRRTACECWSSERDLTVRATPTPAGPFCFTVCAACIARDRAPLYSAPVLVQRVADHCDHLGVRLGELVIPRSPASEQRPAEPSEVCTCGRPAVIVFETDDFGPVGYCGSPALPLVPCRFCGSKTVHEGRSPSYRLCP